MVTLSVIKADVGGFVGHSGPHPDLPAEAREKLNPFHVQQILEAFIGLSRIEPKPDAQQPQPKLSPDSSDSTAADRKTG